ncbi:hypothetical protein R3P38DRAFT_3307865 [Favolaschia claudopus]|uniref:G-protein coupled receptors family 1 profile domain-containing protein n=1 Tax=Favolaschia claudopus TaxID=2862362 RepID=A0AAW0D6G6_9AGAR
MARGNRLLKRMGKAETVRHAFYGLELVGLVGAVFMLVTATVWRKIVRRHPSWFNFMVTWIISCSSYIFFMGQPKGREPNHNLCLIQAALIYSVPTLTSGATFALVIQVYMTLRSLLTLPKASGNLAVVILVIAPYIPAFALFMLSLGLGLRDPSTVYRDAFYCDMKTKLPQKASAIAVVIIMLCCLIVEVIIFKALRRAWITLNRDDRGSISVIVRVLAFTLVGMLIIILSLVFLIIPNYHNTAFNIAIAIIPVSSVIIFGTQQDIFTAWVSGFQNRKAHGEDTWDTFTPNATQHTLSPQVSI